jgi:hypothetical protein
MSNCRDAETIEAIACREGLQLAAHWQNDVNIEFESDCATLVTKLLSACPDRSVISPIINDIKQGLMSRGACTLRKVWREQNGITHNLAKFALKTVAHVFPTILCRFVFRIWCITIGQLSDFD